MYPVQLKTFAASLFALCALSGCGVGLCIDRCLAEGDGPLSFVVPTLNLVPKWQKMEAGWDSAGNAAGYVLIRSPGVAVSWAPTDGEMYSAGQTVGGTHFVVLSGSWTTAADTSLTNGATYHYQVFSYNSAYQYTAGATASGVPGITCPTNYLAIAPNTDVGVTDAFCVAKYEMKNDGSNNAVSQVAGTPWVSITRDDNGGTPGAITRCQNIGTGYDLISNAQWQAVARQIELAQAAGVYLNWSNGSTAGANALNRGHSDSTPFNALAASLDNDPCFGTGQANCANNTHADFTQKRTHTLSSGEVIWDVAGNVYEWVKGDIAPGPPYEGGNNYISQQPWALDLNHPEMWGPFGNYTTKNSGEYGGLGFGFLGFSAGAVFRGGVWADDTVSGVFNASLSVGPLFSVFALGFRCVVVP